MKQQRNTRQRQLVLQAVRACRNHPTADQIYTDLRVVEPTLSRGTVYRNLNILVENGEIGLVKVPGADRYDWRLDRHAHLLCTECRKVEDVSLGYFEELDRQMERESGYQVQRHRLLFEGLCPACLGRHKRALAGDSQESPKVNL